VSIGVTGTVDFDGRGVCEAAMCPRKGAVEVRSESLDLSCCYYYILKLKQNYKLITLVLCRMTRLITPRFIFLFISRTTANVANVIFKRRFDFQT
jgi:hypothetical protein